MDFFLTQKNFSFVSFCLSVSENISLRLHLCSALFNLFYVSLDFYQKLCFFFFISFIRFCYFIHFIQIRIRYRITCDMFVLQRSPTSMEPWRRRISFNEYLHVFHVSICKERVLSFFFFLKCMLICYKSTSRHQLPTFYAIIHYL